jgi:dTDP-glucose 4,6-dehydratase
VADEAAPRALVTGGAGFVGSHLCERLLADGYQVLCVDNIATGSLRNVEHLAGSGFELVEHDITRPLDIPGPIAEIYHFASPASPPDFARIPMPILKVGSYGTFNCLDLAKQKAARFMLASTSEVYGDPAVHPQPESYRGNVNPIGVRSVYDEAKRYAEAVTMAYRRHEDVDTRIVRIFNTYGPRMRLDDGRMIPNFITQALSGRPITVYGDGTQSRSLQYVSDLIEGVVRLMGSDVSLPVNIGNPREFSVLQVAEMVIEASSSSSEIVFQPLPEDDPKRRSPDIGRARAMLDWEPRVPAEEGIRATVAWFASVLDRQGAVA